MKRIVLACALAAMLLGCGPSADRTGGTDVAPAAAAADDDSTTHFNDEEAAQDHCPDDTVVWVNLSSGIYHMSGERWYGATENGTYECQEDADAEGFRQTENGQ
jgi:hypothetical protein